MVEPSDFVVKKLATSKQNLKIVEQIVDTARTEAIEKAVEVAVPIAVEECKRQGTVPLGFEYVDNANNIVQLSNNS